VTVVAGTEGDYYVSPSLDGSRPGAFFARVGGGSTPWYGMATLAYHEAVPGHHYQIALAQESDLPLFRNVLVFTGYPRAGPSTPNSWPTSWAGTTTMPWPDGVSTATWGVCRPRPSVPRAWWPTPACTPGVGPLTRPALYGRERGPGPGFLQFEVSRYLTWPGQATAYMVGMLDIQALRQGPWTGWATALTSRNFTAWC